MALTLEQISQEALTLPSADRATLADRLVESLDPALDDSVWQLWAEEADRRRDDVLSGRVKTIPSEEAFEIIRKAIDNEV